MKRSLTIACLIVAALAVGGGSYVLISHKNNRNTPQSVPQKQNAPVQTKEQADQQNQTTENVPTSSNTSLGELTAKQSGGSITASATIHNPGSGSGSCVFTFENDNDKPVVRQTAPTSGGSICDSGNIPEQEFTYLGQWKLTLRYYSNNTQAVATTDITIR